MFLHSYMNTHNNNKQNILTPTFLKYMFMVMFNYVQDKQALTSLAFYQVQ